MGACQPSAFKQLGLIGLPLSIAIGINGYHLYMYLMVRAEPHCGSYMFINEVVSIILFWFLICFLGGKLRYKKLRIFGYLRPEATG